MAPHRPILSPSIQVIRSPLLNATFSSKRVSNKIIAEIGRTKVFPEVKSGRLTQVVQALSEASTEAMKFGSAGTRAGLTSRTVPP